MISELATAIIRDGLSELTTEFAEHQRAIGGRDTGASADSLRIEIASQDTSVAGQVYGFERLIIQDQGRGPNKSGKPSPDQVKKIRAWAIRKGIDEGAAYPIAAKIAKEGFEGTGVVSDVFNAENVRKKITPRLKSAIHKGFASQLFGK